MSTGVILLSMIISLVETIVFELLFALFFKVRGRSLLLTIPANMLTNPIVTCTYYILHTGMGLPAPAVIIPLEAAAVVTEYLIYKKKSSISRPFLFALGANVFSYSLGEVINYLFNL